MTAPDPQQKTSRPSMRHPSVVMGVWEIGLCLKKGPATLFEDEIMFVVGSIIKAFDTNGFIGVNL